MFVVLCIISSKICEIEVFLFNFIKFRAFFSFKLGCFPEVFYQINVVIHLDV